MNAKSYTLAEARSALPQVKELMTLVQDARREIIRLRPEAWPALRAAAGNGGGRAASDLVPEFQRLEIGIKGITGMGILVKDVDSGIIDFLGRRGGRAIYLCWRHGEEDIAYWHDLDAGFAGRQPIDAHVD